MAKKALTPKQQVEANVEQGLVKILADYENKPVNRTNTELLKAALIDMLLDNVSDAHPGFVFRIDETDGYQVTLKEKLYTKAN
jgi:hypothetical protein